MKDEPPVQPKEDGTTVPPLDFTTFMRNYQNMVYSTAARLVGPSEHAEDIAQEVFLKAFERFPALQSSPTAGGWLKTVTTNLCINHLQRYRNRWKFFSELTRADETEEESEIEFASPDHFLSGVDEEERRAWVEECLDQLPERQRIPLVLYHFENMPYEEIAKKLGISLAKVKTDILRARQALAKVLMRRGTVHEKFEH